MEVQGPSHFRVSALLIKRYFNDYSAGNNKTQGLMQLHYKKQQKHSFIRSNRQYFVESKDFFFPKISCETSIIPFVEGMKVSLF